MSENWKRERYVIKIQDGDPEKVDGISNGRFGIHVNSIHPCRIIVTHLPSGYKMGRSFKVLGAAMEYAERVTPYWNQIRPPNGGPPKVVEEIIKIRSEVDS